MKLTQPQIAFVVLLAVHTLVSLAAYRFLTSTTRTNLPVDSAPIETTTTEQRARGVTSFKLTTQAQLVTFKMPVSVQLYVIFGYAALGLALVLAVFARTSP